MAKEPVYLDLLDLDVMLGNLVAFIDKLGSSGMVTAFCLAL